MQLTTNNYKLPPLKMAYIPEDIKQEILDKASLEKVLNQYHNLSKKKGSNYVVDCPKCGKKDKLEYNPTKKIAKCFSCDIGVKSPVNYLTKFHGKSYKEALEELAKMELIELPEKPKRPKPANKLKQGSYLDKMLKESGLTLADVTDQIITDENTKVERPAYESGSLDERFEIKKGDDVIIHYFDLEGKQMYYYRKDRSGNPTGKPIPFFRVRYQNPSLHVDKRGNSMKYQSPYGSGSKIYIPKAIRRKYQFGAKIKTLYIQEGEKKADKATKHGILSVGVMGIHNIAYNKQLPAEFELIIKRCNVEQVVFLLDADYNELSRKIDSRHPADQRPKSFFTAVKNFRKYFEAFKRNDIYLKIYFAHIKENNENDKGIDDLLTNSLRGKEDELVELCDNGLLDPKGDAKWIQFHDITTMSDFKLLEFWGLQNKDAFAKKYLTVLKELPEFKYGRELWKINPKNNQLELAQPLMDHEQFWVEKVKEDKNGNRISTTYQFDHANCYNFLESRGFARFKTSEQNKILVKTENNIIREIDTVEIRDYIINFAKELNMKDMRNMLYRNSSKYFGADSLSHIDYTNPAFHEASKGVQYLYYNETYWRITAEDIEVNKLKELNGAVWKDQIKDFSPTKLPLLIDNIHQISDEDIAINSDLKNYKGEYSLDITPIGKKCHFLQFLLNTSDFRKIEKRFTDDYTLEETFEMSRHFLSKITAIGYMLHNYRDSGILKAVIAMDGKMSEVGASHGRSGKSLIGELIRRLIPTAYISGKKKDLTDDRFKWEGIDQRTQNVFIDDIRANFDFEALFPEITGDFQIEGKGVKRFTLPREKAPKIFITTNHAIKGEGGSFSDRQFLIGFSDYYNNNHKPIDDFGVLFFDEWNQEQWNLTYNFAALCLHIYFKHGLIEAPTERLEKRRLRQMIGEAFLEWADEFFSREYNVRNRVEKSTMYNGDDITSGKGFVTKFPREKTYCNISKFKKKLKDYCKFKGWEFNPCKNGADIKSNGREYIEIYPPDEVYEAISTQKQLF